MQFRYASFLDSLMMLLGALCAIAHGAALPLLMRYFGQIINTLIFQDISSRFARDISNQTGMEINCSSVFNYTLGNLTLTDTTITSIFQDIPGSGFPNAECLLGDEFISQVDIIVLIFVGIAVGVLVVATLQVFTYQFAAERQVYKIRTLYYRAILRQDIAWFDTNPTGELVNRLSE